MTPKHFARRIESLRNILEALQREVYNSAAFSLDEEIAVSTSLATAAMALQAAQLQVWPEPLNSPDSLVSDLDSLSAVTR